MQISALETASVNQQQINCDRNPAIYRMQERQKMGTYHKAFMD